MILVSYIYYIELLIFKNFISERNLFVYKIVNGFFMCK